MISVARALKSQQAVSLPEEFLVIENTGIEPERITWDAKSLRLFIGSRSGEIWAIDGNRIIAPAGPDGDADRRARILRSNLH